MSIKRRQRREAQAHFAVLADVLGGFYEFLCQTPQPTDEEVRAQFIQRNHSWQQYCAKKQLNKSAYDMFKSEVAQLWAKRKAQNAGTTEK